MLKKNILFLSLFSVLQFANAQTEDKDTLLNTISLETCECVEKKGLDYTSNNTTKLELEFGLCIMESYGRHKKKAEKLLNVSLNDEASLEQFGEDIAFKMIDNCPDVIMALAGNYAAEEFEEVKDDLTLEGEFVSIESLQFNMVEIKGDNNRTQKLIWLQYFEGQELLSNTKKLKGKNLEVIYLQKELYDPKINEYRNFKVIKKISIL